jgi:hypothetical protein
MKDFSVRIQVTPARLQILEEKCLAKKHLPVVKDYLFKPKGKPLKDFNPGDICIRLRDFSNSNRLSTLKEITKEDERILGEAEAVVLFEQAERLGYETWGELTRISVEYVLKFENQLEATVFDQKIIPVDENAFLKVESTTKEGLKEALKMLLAENEEIIAKNAAELLAEKMGLI